MEQQFPYTHFFNTSQFPYKDIFSSIGNVWEAIGHLKFFIDDLFARNIVKGNYEKAPLVFIGKGTIIDEGVKIEGPAIIGENCIIKHGALLREYCLFGNNVIIGHSSEIKRSIFLNDAAAAHLNYIGDSIVGNLVNIAGGAITANFRFDKQKIKIKSNNTLIETGLQKLGAIIGDESNIGVNAVLNPGTILGKNSVIYPLTSVLGVHGEKAIIK